MAYGGRIRERWRPVVALGNRPTVRLTLAGLSMIGYALCLQALLGHGIVDPQRAAGGGDTFAYWLAGQHVLSGAPVYGIEVGQDAAFLYPPPFAQMFAPLSLLPLPVVVWIWRLVELGSLRIAVGSWRNAGLAMLLWPPLLTELDAANVHLVLAAAVALAIRGDARAVLPAAVMKFATLAVIPLAARTEPRGLLIGLGLAVAICLASFALAPWLWFDYVRFLGGAAQPEPHWYNLAQAVPLWLRFSVAGLFAILAVRWPRLAVIATTLALPVIWFQGLSVLVALAARPGRKLAVVPNQPG